MRLDYRGSLLLTALGSIAVALAFVWMALTTDVAHASATAFDVFALPSGKRLHSHRGEQRNFEQAHYTIAFSPDSKEMAFVSKHEAKDAEMWTTNHDVWTVPASGGPATKVTSNTAADFQPTANPQFSA